MGRPPRGGSGPTARPAGAERERAVDPLGPPTRPYIALKLSHRRNRALRPRSHLGFTQAAIPPKVVPWVVLKLVEKVVFRRNSQVSAGAVACAPIRQTYAVSDAPRFPFGQPSKARPPRKPTGSATAVVVGVYPSALHVQWTLPTWAHGSSGSTSVRALAVDDEPTVFWDGADGTDRVAAWAQAVDFREGDGEGEWGHVRSSGNGTSGSGVVDDVLTPLGLGAAEVWFTDVIDRFFVKRGTTKRRGQADVIDQVYEPFRIAAKLSAATLPPRPSPAELIHLATAEHRERLREELTDAHAPMLITLGEEARAVLAAIVDTSSGAPALPLTTQRFTGAGAAEYGEAGTATVSGHEVVWHALAHPGQRTGSWRVLREQWIERRRAEA